MPWLQEGGQVRLVGSASMDGFVETNLQKVTSNWFFLYTSKFLLAVSSFLTLLETKEVSDEGWCWTTPVASMSDMFPKNQECLNRK